MSATMTQLESFIAQEIKMPNLTKDFEQAIGVIPTIDFDYFHFAEHGWNYNIAKELAVLLIDNVNIDELRNLTDINEKGLWDSSVGTGGTGWNMMAPTKAAQRSILASHFSSYARKQYSSCYLSLYEYQCLKDLLQDIEDSNYGDHRKHIYEADIKLLAEVCAEFKREYLRKNPEYLFTILSEEQ